MAATSAAAAAAVAPAVVAADGVPWGCCKAGGCGPPPLPPAFKRRRVQREKERGILGPISELVQVTRQARLASFLASDTALKQLPNELIDIIAAYHNPCKIPLCGCPSCNPDSRLKHKWEVIRMSPRAEDDEQDCYYYECLNCTETHEMVYPPF